MYVTIESANGDKLMIYRRDGKLIIAIKETDKDGGSMAEITIDNEDKAGLIKAVEMLGY